MPSTDSAPVEPPASPSRPPLDTLPIAGFTRRRVAVLVAGLVVLWLVGVFARQVGDASSATAQADAMRARNAALASDVTALQRERQIVQQPAFVAEAARAYRLGSPREIPFTLDPSAPSPAAGAPGSAGVATVDPPERRSPLDSWLQLLFGPSPGN